MGSQETASNISHSESAYSVTVMRFVFSVIFMSTDTYVTLKCYFIMSVLNNLLNLGYWLLLISVIHNSKCSVDE